jgi:hypothetical protein
MLNDIVQELVEARSERVRRIRRDDVADLIFDALDIIAPGARNGLLGIDAMNDGITWRLWCQAISAIEMSPDLVFPGWDGESQPVPDPAHYSHALSFLSIRVARAILVTNGYGDDPCDVSRWSEHWAGSHQSGKPSEGIWGR